MLILLLVIVHVFAVPDVLPGSNVTVPLNFGDVCQSRYLYPDGYSLGEQSSFFFFFFCFF